VTTDDPEIARTVSLLRFNGEDRETGEYHMHGYTALLDNVQAAVLDVKLAHLPEWIAHRRHIAERYTQGLAGIDGLGIPRADEDGRHDVFQNYVITTSRRAALRDHLRRDGVETLVHWPKPVWRHEGLGLIDPTVPVTERLCGEVLSLPMSAETTAEHVDVTVASIRAFFS
jgi:dTDP-4-amino-4,6-dideoxygalactose transaminase